MVGLGHFLGGTWSGRAEATAIFIVEDSLSKDGLLVHYSTRIQEPTFNCHTNLLRVCVVLHFYFSFFVFEPNTRILFCPDDIDSNHHLPCSNQDHLSLLLLHRLLHHGTDNSSPISSPFFPFPRSPSPPPLQCHGTTASFRLPPPLSALLFSPPFSPAPPSPPTLPTWLKTCAKNPESGDKTDEKTSSCFP
jgi:hypothetical protein